MQLAITNLLNESLELPYLEKSIPAKATITFACAQADLSKMVDLQLAVAVGSATYQVTPDAIETASGILTAGLPLATGGGGDVVEVRPINGTSDDWLTLMTGTIPAAIAANKKVLMLPGLNGEKWQALTLQKTPQNARIVGTPNTRIKQGGTCTSAFFVGEEYDGGGVYTDTVLAADAGIGSMTIVLNSLAITNHGTDTGATWQAGKWLIITEPPTPASQPQYGHIRQIVNINTGTKTLTLDAPLKAKVFAGTKVLQLNDLTAANIIIEGNGMRISGTGGYHVSYWYARDCNISGLVVDALDGALTTDTNYGPFWMGPGSLRCTISECRVDPGQACYFGFNLGTSEDSKLVDCKVNCTGLSYGFIDNYNMDCTLERCSTVRCSVQGYTVAGSIRVTHNKCSDVGSAIGLLAADPAISGYVTDLTLNDPSFQENTTAGIDDGAGINVVGGSINSINGNGTTIRSNHGNTRVSGTKFGNKASSYGYNAVKNMKLTNTVWGAGGFVGQVSGANAVVTHESLNTYAGAQFNIAAVCRMIFKDCPSMAWSANGLAIGAQCVVELENVKITGCNHLSTPSANNVCFRMRGMVDIGSADLATGASGSVTASRGTVVLSSGVGTVAFFDVNANDKPRVDVVTPGGTMGAHYKVVVTPGTGFVVTSINTSGATVTTDTSTLSYSF